MNKKRKNTQYKTRTMIMAATMLMLMIVVVLLMVRLIKSDKENQRHLKAVNALEEKNAKLDQASASYESMVADLNNKVSELESEKEQMSVRNQELESIVSQSGIKEKIDENEKVVFLTFDDGPSNLTPEFLKVLNSYGVHATFFVTYQPQHEAIYKQIIENGNAIQIHTATHDYDSVYQSVDAYLADFNQAYEYVCSVTGKQPGYFRFPGGSTNSYGKSIVRDIARTMKERGFDFVDWNVSVGDGSAAATKDSMVQKIMAESEGKNHVVMLAHDSGAKSETLAALPQIIEYYKNNGYNFKVIDGNVDISFAQFIEY